MIINSQVALASNRSVCYIRPMHATAYRFAPAAAISLTCYNRLIARSKAMWSWPAGYLEAVLPLLAMTPAYVAESRSFEVRRDGRLVGICALLLDRPTPLLDHLWIEPAETGRGAGRAALGHLVGVARAAGEVAIEVAPDPPAEDFYAAQGFEYRGPALPPRVKGGPLFRLMRLSLAQ